jgi:hypothetical protein
LREFSPPASFIVIDRQAVFVPPCSSRRGSRIPAAAHRLGVNNLWLSTK